MLILMGILKAILNRLWAWVNDGLLPTGAGREARGPDYPRPASTARAITDRKLSLMLRSSVRIAFASRLNRRHLTLT
jgi:hypothetical protein